jgi:CTP:molybdopterin cytidylyltransferase MocA
MSVAAVVLAAGESARMGRPKAFLQWRGRTFVEQVVELARGAGCTPIVVVGGATPLPELGVDVVVNAGWRRGPLSSLQVGLRAMAMRPWTGVLVLTVDRPHLRPRTMTSLVEEHARRPDAVLQPAHDGRRGHPILHPRDVAELLLELPPLGNARDVVRRPDIAARRASVPVEDPAVHDNIDTPEALARLLSSSP